MKTEGAPYLPQGVTPHELTPISTPFCTKGPPLSPVQTVSFPVSKPPVQIIESSKLPEWPTMPTKILSHAKKYRVILEIIRKLEKYFVEALFPFERSAKL